jgi:hypothetical protein
MPHAPAHPPPQRQSPPRDVAHLFWYFGDVRVGTLGQRAGVPVDVDQWRWSCGFSPGCGPGEHRHGTAPDFFTARREFEIAWRELSATKTETDYQAWRHQRDFTARKYASWERGEKPPRTSSIMRCVCGVRFDSHKPDESYDHRGHIYTARG